MKNGLLNTIYRFLVILSVAFFYIGCAKTHNQNNSTQGGGFDTSGGDTIKSSLEEVIAATEDFEARLTIAIRRLLLSSNSKASIDSQKHLTPTQKSSLQKFVNLHKRRGRLLTELVSFKKVKITFLNDQYCQAKNEHKAGSAKGNVQNGEICISRKALQNTSPEAIENQALSLALHEYAHLLGFNEIEAHSLQKIVTSKPLLFNPKKKNLVWLAQKWDLLSLNFYYSFLDYALENPKNYLDKIQGGLAFDPADFLRLDIAPLLDPDSDIIQIDIEIYNKILKLQDLFYKYSSLFSDSGTNGREASFMEMSNYINEMTELMQELNMYMIVYMNPDIYFPSEGYTFPNSMVGYQTRKYHLIGKLYTTSIRTIRRDEVACSGAEDLRGFSVEQPVKNLGFIITFSNDYSKFVSVETLDPFSMKGKYVAHEFDNRVFIKVQGYIYPDVNEKIDWILKYQDGTERKISCRYVVR